MKLPTLWSFQDKEAREGPPEMTLADLETLSETHQLTVSEEGFVLATPLPRELGTTSPSPWTSFTRQEYNTQLQGIKGYEKYDKMRKSDGTVRGNLRSLKIPALSGRWFIAPATEDAQDKEIAEWVWCNLTDKMSIAWTQVLIEALLMCDFGNYMFESVWDNRIVDGELRTVLTKLAPRHPMDVKEWKFDVHGGPKAVVMYPSSMQDGNMDIVIPIEKLLVFTYDREAGNIEGISMLRSVYKHWYFKESLYKIDAIQKERHGIGIPIIKLPVGYKDEDKTVADELGRNIRTNERAHITLPNGWELSMLKLEGNLTDALASIEHHNDSIREAFLTNFVVEGAREDDLVMFFKAARVVADIICDSFNLYLIPKMVKYNWPEVEEFPKLKVRRVGEAADWRTLTFALRNLAGAGMLIPDRPLEDLLRDEMDLPPVDEETSRIIATPQNPYDDAEERDDPGVDYAKPANQNIGTGSTDDETHNTNNPAYNRRSRRRPGRKQRGQIAGLPRQTPVNRARNSFGVPRRGSGNDRSGG